MSGRITLAVGLAVGVSAGAALAGVPVDPGAQPPGPSRVAVVVYAGPPGGVPRATAAQAGARAAGVTSRAPRSVPEQLSVTARLAAEGYTAIVGVGLDHRRAIRPLDGRVRHVPVTLRGPCLASRIEALARRARATTD